MAIRTKTVSGFVVVCTVVWLVMLSQYFAFSLNTQTQDEIPSFNFQIVVYAFFRIYDNHSNSPSFRFYE